MAKGKRRPPKKKISRRRRPFRLLFSILALPATTLAKAMGLKPRHRPFIIALGEGWVNLARIF